MMFREIRRHMLLVVIEELQAEEGLTWTEARARMGLPHPLVKPDND
jgi:hypothetical protein